MAANLRKSDTIAAIATAPGAGGIGIIRISGPEAFSIFQALFTPFRPRDVFSSHTLYYGTVADREGEVLDEVLAVYMKAPNTYTREDVVELQSHGSSLVLTSILSEIFRLGVRPAEPGEFTKRAFMAGRIDLTQAEAVADLLEARTDSGARLAVGQMQGRLFTRIEEIRQSLLNTLAVFEVAIDFPDDDLELIDSERILAQLEEQAVRPLTELVALSDKGKIIREGIKLVIAGLPNVGKSSLLNALLLEDRALVTPVPGTTRDTIEEFISINGMPARIVDTAGIRASAESVEELGVQRARQKVREADIVLFLVDGSISLTDQDKELYRSLGSTERLVVFNKMDIADPESMAAKEAFFAGANLVRIAAREHEGLSELLDAVSRMVMGSGSTLHEREACAPNVRHRAILEETLAACERLREALHAGVTMDLVAVEVQSALESLGDIVGLTTTEDVLDRIFAEFCIGK